MPKEVEKRYKVVGSVGWFILALVLGCGNDLIVQYLSVRGVSSDFITLGRLLGGVVWLMPWWFFSLYKEKEIGECSGSNIPWWLYGVRGVLTFVAILLWVGGVRRTSVVTATLFNFTMPIFSFIIAPLVLGERKPWYRVLALVAGFCGGVLTLYPGGRLQIDGYAVFFVLSILCFVSLDVLAKKYGSQVSMVAMVFYPKVVAMVCAGVWWYLSGENSYVMAREVWLGLALLGVSSNVLVYAILRAYRGGDLTLFAPLRYVELVIAMLGSYVFFGQLPTWYEWVASMVIVPMSFFVVRLSSKGGS